MKIKETEAAIEAILFAMGGSVELSRIAKAIGVDEKTTGKIIRNMMDRYQEENRGIQIIELENSFQMCTKKEYYEYLINIALHPQKPVLTDVMLETLSIIAYKQPVTKAEIEKIRGVKCDHAINKLWNIIWSENWDDWMLRVVRFCLGLRKNFCAVSAYRILNPCLYLIRFRLKILRQKQRKKFS